MKKYKANYHNWVQRIEEIEIEKETEHFVLIKGKKHKDAKSSRYYKLFDTREQAKQHLIDKKIREIEREKENLLSLESDLSKLQSL